MESLPLISSVIERVDDLKYLGGFCNIDHDMTVRTGQMHYPFYNSKVKKVNKNEGLQSMY